MMGGMSGSIGMIFFTMPSKVSRRTMLKSAAAGIASVAFASWASGAESNKPIRLGFIGVGERGTTLLREVLAHQDVQVPAVCDINEKNLNRALDLIEKSRGQRPD